MTDPSPLAWLPEAIDQYEQQNLLRRRCSYSGLQRAEIKLGSETLINFGSNDYLGLSHDGRLAAAARQALDEVGWGAGASPLVTGYHRFHQQLEAELAEFEQAEAALLFSSGYAANLGTIGALVEKEDVIFSDAKNHASIIDGSRLSRATVFIYRHNDLEHLQELLAAHAGYRRKLIVTDTLFSMDGDLAPIQAIAQLALRYGCMLVLDEAHATGVFGPHGQGLSELLPPDLKQAVTARVGTLSKAFGCAGGFVVGSQQLIDWLSNRARSYMFSTAHPAATAAAALAALQIIRQEPERRERLLATAQELRQNLKQQGWNTGASQSQVVPIYIGDARATMELMQHLRAQGMFVPGIRPPSVPPGESLLRVSLTAAHTPAMVQRLTDVLQACRR